MITDQRGKQLVVDVNRLKGACDPVEWQVTKRENTERNVRPKRPQPEVEEYLEVPSIGPIPVREPQVENLPRGRSPTMNRQTLDTPHQVLHPEKHLVTIVWIPHTYRRIHLGPEDRRERREKVRP